MYGFENLFLIPILDPNLYSFDFTPLPSKFSNTKWVMSYLMQVRLVLISFKHFGTELTMILDFFLHVEGKQVLHFFNSQPNI